MFPVTPDTVRALAGRLAGPVLLPDDDGFDAELAGFNLAVRPRPDVVVGARTAEDVREAVAFAAAHGMPVGVRNTGHGPAGASADGGLLVSTRRMTDLRVDPAARTAWVAAGVRSGDLTAEAARHGLAPLNGSAPQVGFVAYVLGGGMSLLARSHGLAVDRVRALEVVTADGRYRRVAPAPTPAAEEPAAPDSDAALAWALLGGRDNFGIVTAVEVELFPLDRFYGGGLYFDAEAYPDVLEIYRRWTRTVPEEMNSSLALVPLPDGPELPEPLRGRVVYHVRIAAAAPAAQAEALVAPLHEAGPRLMEWGAEMPYRDSAAVHDEPPTPMAWSAESALLRDLDAGTARRILAWARAGTGRGPIVEIRHLGGAAARGRAGRNAVGHRDARYHLGALVPLPDGGGPGDVDAVPAAETLAAEETLAELSDIVAPVRVGRFVTLLGHGGTAGSDAVRSAYTPADHDRLRELKAVWDPADLFRRNHHIPPAAG